MAGLDDDSDRLSQEQVDKALRHYDGPPGQVNSGGGKAPPVPGPGATDPERRAWLAALFNLENGFTVGEPTRFGGTSRSPMMIPILAPGGIVAATIRFEEEREIGNPRALRGALARDAGVRGATINSGKSAGDVYYVLCALAKTIGRLDPLIEAAEWIDEYQRDALPITGYELGRRGAFQALDALRTYPYSKRAINLYIAAVERGITTPGDAPPRPPLLIDETTGRAWTSAKHLGTFVRHDRDRAEPITDTALVGRVLEQGCERLELNVWDRSDRKRRERIKMVLIGFPEPPERPADDVLDALDALDDQGGV